MPFTGDARRWAGHRRLAYRRGVTGGVLSRPLGAWHEPEQVARLLDQGPGLVWHDPDAGGRIGFVGVPSGEDDVVIVADDGRVLRDGRPVQGVGRGLDGLAQVLRAGLAGRRVRSSRLGWWGAIGYEAGARALGRPAAASVEPAAMFLLVDRGIVMDPARHLLTAVVAADAADAEQWLATTAALASSSAVPTRSEPVGAGRATWRLDRDAYLDRVARCQQAIVRGDAYQLCLTTNIDVDLPGAVDPLGVYERLRRSAPAPHGGVLRVGDTWLLSGSPERLLAVDGAGRARTTPIKGTRPRDEDPERDAALAAELVASEKERAENLMIVDLSRNDLSRVSQVGSVAVHGLFEVRSYRRVHQLTSTVAAVLSTDAIGALLALFPAGSMTGAPKLSAMNVLAGLEVGARGMYSGAWGRLSFDGTADLAVVIRSVVLTPGQARVGTGGGITSDSRAGEEWDEAVLKAGSMLSALCPDVPHGPGMFG